MNIVLLCLLYTCYALSRNEYKHEFETFRHQYRKSYSSRDEYDRRFSIFIQNYDKINDHNDKKLPWVMGVNEFTDLTWDEFKTLKLGYENRRRSGNIIYSFSDNQTLPEQVDWTSKGVVSEVRNQGQCGSCFAHSSVEAVESAIAIKTGTLQKLSVQHAMDCSRPEGDQSCEGGLMDYVFQFIIDNHGICSDQDYPYLAVDEACKSCTPVATIKSFVDVEHNNEDALLKAVSKQPISVAIEADQYTFQFYQGGVFDGSCGTNLDHGVLLTGYGTDDGKDYWKVMNSWGESWGENGYIRMIRRGGKGPGQCGIAMDASFPVV